MKKQNNVLRRLIELSKELTEVKSLSDKNMRVAEELLLTYHNQVLLIPTEAF